MFIFQISNDELAVNKIPAAVSSDYSAPLSQMGDSRQMRVNSSRAERLKTEPTSSLWGSRKQELCRV